MFIVYGCLYNVHVTFDNITIGKSNRKAMNRYKTYIFSKTKDLICHDVVVVSSPEPKAHR